MRSIALVVVLVLLPMSAFAQEESPPPPPETHQRNFGLTGTVGYDGVAAGIRVGTSRVAIDVTGGFVPLIAAYHKGDWVDTKFVFYPTFQLDAGASVMIFQRKRIGVGLMAEYKLNSLLGHGVGGGVQAEYDIAKHFVAHVVIGPAIYPNGAENVRDTDDIPAGGRVHRWGTTLSFALHVGMTFYP